MVKKLVDLVPKKSVFDDLHNLPIGDCPGDLGPRHGITE